MELFSGLNQKKKTVAQKERRKSFGIGGAGNIRTQDQAVVSDAYDLVERRRSRLNSLNIDSPAREGPGTSRRSSSISETLKHAFTSSSK
ncbi:hypothetical protein ANO14919_028460 [Xylariales sp. No.14919]|nr:hypothetical protein F5X98DRAFT_356964 [Xylaria grammica]GAW13460.1 hypothetical protein ANO14919_028460 [Xylariales sp. No.14919]